MSDVQYREFNVGDVVYVVDKPYTKCPFHWAPRMSKHCGAQAVIKSKRYVESAETYCYTIDLDDGDCWWCGNCFQPIEDGLEDTVTTDEELYNLLGLRSVVV